MSRESLSKRRRNNNCSKWVLVGGATSKTRDRGYMKRDAVTYGYESLVAAYFWT